ncbi:MAG: NFACT RNA binding domain-containing protein [Cyclobacteriaceae bacterium]
MRQLSTRLQQHLPGHELLEVFSQNKNELILGFARKGEEFYIRASLNADFSCLSFPENFHRSKRNSVDLFSELIGLPVLSVDQFENERSFMIHLGAEYGLLFKLHGNRSNILLCKGDKVEGLFKNKMSKDKDITPSQLKRPIEQTWENFEAHDYRYQELFPTFGKEIKEYLEKAGYFLLSPQAQWQFIQQLLDELNNPPFYIYEDEQQKPLLSMINMDMPKEVFSDSIAAINCFYSRYTREYYLQKEKAAVISNLHHQRKQAGNYIIKTEKQLHDLKINTRHEELANIIMANLHNIPPKSSSAELYDFYRDEPVTIKLKKDLTPQKNAENLYRKAKNQKIELDTLQRNIDQKKEELEAATLHLQILATMDSVKELRQYLKENNLQKSKTETTEDFPFRRFQIDGYEVWVGKNARNNDELISGYAKKDDLWLHAKDVSGSHVIIKNKPGTNFPSLVIEKAAALAAYYSRRKNDTLCPVIYTPRKYIFKSKGMASGQVRVEKEEVILVPPAKLA